MNETLAKNDFVKIILNDGQIFIGIFVFEWENYFRIRAPWWGTQVRQLEIFNLHQIKKVEKLPPLQLLTNSDPVIRNYIKEHYFQSQND